MQAGSQGLKLGHGLGCHRLLVPVLPPFGMFLLGEEVLLCRGSAVPSPEPHTGIRERCGKKTLSVGSDVRQEICMREVGFRGC